MYDIMLGVAINLVTAVIMAVITALAYLMVYYFQRSEIMKDLRRFINPKSRVIVSDTKIRQTELLKETTFNRLLTEEEQKKILEQDGKRNLFNGASVRLDSLGTDGTAKVSIIGFFDFMTTNLVVRPASRAKKSALNTLYSNVFSDTTKEAVRLERRVKAAVKGQPTKTFNDVISIKELANVLTVSVLLEDSTGRVLIVKRGDKVAVSSGNFATSCAGTIAEEDLKEKNCFIACAQRELKEELGLDCKLHIDSLVISKQKLQPAVLLSGRLDNPFESFLDKIKNAEDFNEENSMLFAVPKEELPGIVKKYQFTDVASFQLVPKCTGWITKFPKSIMQYQLEI